MREYTLKVGDLCFVAIGQIVGRNLVALRYRPTACLVINSPVETPILARRVREDWGGLTAEAHRESLTRNALAPGRGHELAVTRLMWYFPDRGLEIARKLLNRPLLDSTPVFAFVLDRLLTEKDPARWHPLIEEFERQHGPRARASIPPTLVAIYWTRSGMDSATLRAQMPIAAKILASEFRDFDPDHPPFLDVAGPDQQAELVRALAPIESKPIDEAILHLYRSIRPDEFRSKHRLYEVDCLVVLCVKRLAPRGYPEALVPFLLVTIREAREEMKYRLWNVDCPIKTIPRPWPF